MAAGKEWWSKAFEGGVYPLSELVNSPAWRAATRRELYFMSRALWLPKGARVLDVGCGVGRHSLGLAAYGHVVTGVDISARYLAEARGEARRRGLAARFLRADMRRLDWKDEFDAAVNLFTTFGYFADPADDLRTLRGVQRALAPGGRFLLETINGPWVSSLLRQAEKKGIRSRHWTELDGVFMLEDPSLDEGGGAIRTRWVVLRGAKKKEVTSTIRLYDKPGLSRLLQRAGFQVEGVYGDMEGGRYAPGASHRLVVLARKPL